MKKISKIFILFSLILALTGCMKMNMNMEITEDLKMNVSMEMLMQESILSSLGTSKEEMVSSMKEEMESEIDDAKVEEIEKTIDGETWIGISVTSDELYDLEADKILEKNGDIITLTLPMNELSDEMDMGDIDDMGYSIEDLKSSGVEMNLTIKMPGEVTSNVGEVTGDTVTIDLLELMNGNNNIENIEIEANVSKKVSSGLSNNTMIYIAIAIGVIVVIVIIIFVVKKKKKQSKNILEDTYNEKGEKPLYINEDKISFCPHCGNKLNGEDICPQCHKNVK